MSIPYLLNFTYKMYMHTYIHTCIVVIVSNVSLFGYIVSSAELNEFSDRYSLIEQSPILCDHDFVSLRYCCHKYFNREIQIILMICKSNFNIGPGVWMYVHTYVLHYTYLLIS